MSEEKNEGEQMQQEMSIKKRPGHKEMLAKYLEAVKGTYKIPLIEDAEILHIIDKMAQCKKAFTYCVVCDVISETDKTRDLHNPVNSFTFGGMLSRQRFHKTCIWRVEMLKFLTKMNALNKHSNIFYVKRVDNNVSCKSTIIDYKKLTSVAIAEITSKANKERMQENFFRNEALHYEDCFEQTKKWVITLQNEIKDLKEQNKELSDELAEFKKAKPINMMIETFIKETTKNGSSLKNLLERFNKQRELASKQEDQETIPLDKDMKIKQLEKKVQDLTEQLQKSDIKSEQLKTHNPDAKESKENLIDLTSTPQCKNMKLVNSYRQPLKSNQNCALKNISNSSRKIKKVR